MKNNGLISEGLDFRSEVLTVTSAAGATSKGFDMADHYKGFLSVCIMGNASVTPVAVDIMESSAATVAGTSAVGSKVGILVGTSVNTALPAGRGVQSLTLIQGTGATGATGDAVQIGLGTKTRTFVASTSTALINSSAWSATRSYYGSTVASTANGGETGRIDSLITAIRSTLNFGDAIIPVSTPTTDSVQLSISDGAEGPISFIATGATQGMIISQWNEAVAAFNVAAEELNSSANKRYVSVKVSTGATSLRCGVVFARQPKFAPSNFIGNMSTVNFAT